MCIVAAGGEDLRDDGAELPLPPSNVDQSDNITADCEMHGFPTCSLLSAYQCSEESGTSTWMGPGDDGQTRLTLRFNFYDFPRTVSLLACCP